MQQLRNNVLILFVLIGCAIHSTAQQASQLLINMAPLDGIEISADNCLNYQILLQSSKVENVLIKGVMTWRNSAMKIEYSFKTTLQIGSNSFSTNSIHPTWAYSQVALQELFQQYKTLPQGTMQYCVQVYSQATVGEQPNSLLAEECIYYQKNDFFLINLNEPENNAKIYEFNPLLSWTVNFPFASELSYTLKLTDAKSKQNNQSAISRNPLILKQNGINSLFIMYPITAKKLESYTPYVWTVDAYYKGILLGGAEPWRFTILEDSLNESLPQEMSYIEVNIENGTNISLIAGEIKLKFIEKERRNNSLSLKLVDAENKEIKSFQRKWDIRMGENRVVYNLHELELLKHKKMYSLLVTDLDNNVYQIRFKYFNPDFIK